MVGTRFILALIVVVGAVGPAAGAHFWLSGSPAGIPGPEAPAINPKVGELTTLYVWGRPTPGRQLDAVSLTVVASTTDLDFEDGTYVFYNTIDGTTDRFELVRDSTTTPDLNSNFSPAEIGLGFPDVLSGVNGATLDDSTDYRGPGPVCSAAESDCEVAGDGAPAWLIASFGVRALDATASADLYLQVGDRGFTERELADGDYDLGGAVGAEDYTVWATGYGSTAAPAADGSSDGVIDAADYTVWRDHIGDVATLLDLDQTDVHFGVDARGGDEPVYHSENLAERQMTKAGDDPDATFTIASPATAVPEPSTGLLLAVVLGRLISKPRPGPTHRGVES